MNECLRHMLKYICSSPISLLDFPRLTLAKAKEMLKRTAAPGASRLVGASWVRRPGRTFCPQLVPPSSHLASWHLFIETAAGKIGYCTRFFLTLVNKGLVLGSLVVCWAPCQRWSNIQGNGCYCPPIGHIQDHIRWGRGMNSPISLLHS